MSDAFATPSIPDAVFVNNKGWQRPGESADDCYVRTQARNALICRDNDAGTRLSVIGRTYNLHNTTVTRILAENGRRPNIDPTPAGARDVPAKRPHQIARPVSSYDPSVARIRMDSADLLKAILSMAVRNDILVPGMTYDEMRQRCFETGVAFPA